METELFRDRIDAGKKLAQQLLEYSSQDTCVLAIPNGGVPVGFEVAKRLNAKFDVIIPKKIPIPWNPEAGFGAISADGTMVLNDNMVRGLGLSKDEIEQAAVEIRNDIERKTREYRGDRPAPDIEGKTVIIIDDGLASGYTMLAAIESIRKSKPLRIIAAVPVASRGASRLIAPKVDKLVVLITGERLPFAVASFYMIWHDVTDDEVLNYLKQAEEPNKKI
ncbi:MAG: phosphoribosyltransferase [Armatimonadota bacterium]